MFDTLRKANETWIVKILFAILILSFGVWGIGDVVRSRITETPAITVGDKDFTPEEVADRFRREVQRMSPMFGNKLTVEQARQFGLLQRTINQMVDGALLDEAADRLKIGADDETLRKTIANFPAFQSPLKMFDKSNYLRVLQQMGLTDRQFVAMERADLARGQLVKAITGGAAVPVAMAAPMFRYQSEKRVAEFVVFQADKVPAPAAPDAAALQKYYDDHKAQFRSPETRSASALVVHSADLAGTIHPADADIEKAYQARMGEFQTPEKRTVSQVLFNDEASAKAFLDKAKDVKGYEAALKETGKSAIDLGTTSKADLPLPELGDPAFAVTVPGLAGPVQSTLGWHVLAVTGVTPGKTRPLAEVKEAIVKDLVKDEVTNKLYSLQNQLEDSVGAGNDVAETAKSLGLKAIALSSVDERGRDADGKPIDQAISPEVLGTIFSTGAGSTSDATALGNNDGYFIVHVDKVNPASIRPLDQVKMLVEASWTEEARVAAARKAAEDAAAKLKSNEPWTVLGNGVKVETTKPFQRAGAANQVPPVLAAEMFRQKVGGVAVVTNGPDSMVARLKDIQTPEAEGAGFQAARNELNDVIVEDLMQQYVQALRKDIGVHVNQSVIDQQFAAK